MVSQYTKGVQRQRTVQHTMACISTSGSASSRFVVAATALLGDAFVAPEPTKAFFLRRLDLPSLCFLPPVGHTRQVFVSQEQRVGRSTHTPASSRVCLCILYNIVHPYLALFDQEQHVNSCFPCNTQGGSRQGYVCRGGMKEAETQQQRKCSLTFTLGDCVLSICARLSVYFLIRATTCTRCVTRDG